MLEARLIPMREAADEMKRIPEELFIRVEDMARVERSLQDLTGVDDVRRRLRQTQRQLNEKADQVLRMAWTLDNICRLYQKSEREIETYCEEGRTQRRTEEFAEYSLDWVADILQR